MATISGEVRDENGDLLAGAVVRAYRRDTGALLAAGTSSDGFTPIVLDADYDSVSLLLHFDGTDGSTTFTDNSGTPKTFTAVGNAHIETDQAKFGPSSGAFDGNDRITCPVHTDFQFGTGDFTIEFWMYPTSSAADADIVCHRVTSDGANLWYVRRTTGGILRFYNKVSNSVIFDFSTTGFPVALNVWTHVALVRSSTSIKGYLNGVERGSATASGAMAYPNTTLAVGAADDTGGIVGYIDEVRITKGVARYTGTFIPPIDPFPDAESLTAPSIGAYSLTTAYADEVQVIALDPAGGTTFNDLILRTTPV